jgi:hypothetical protein
VKASLLYRAIVASVLLAAMLPVHASACERPDAVTPDGGRYCGSLRDGIVHGEGVIEWSNGERYEGGFVLGKFSGTGRLRFASGDVYEGEFHDGLMEGRGRMALVDGGIYTGEFRRDYFNGDGRFESPGDLVYEGTFKDGRYHGRGKFRGPGSTYEGEFRQGEFWGGGKLVYADGRLYEGEFVRGRFHGKGRYVNASGDVYEGEFVDDVLTGTGRLRVKEGGRYEGGFLNWRYQGAGVFTTAQGDVYEGEFANGELTGGRHVQKGGATYEGDFQRWRPHGQGSMKLANGDHYKGGFAYGLYEGEGTLTLAKPRPDGKTQQSGTWRYGVLDQPEERARLHANVESALYAQRRLLDRSLAAVLPHDPKRIDMYLLAIAGDGTQEVFRREVEFVRDQFARRFRTRGRTVVLANSRSTVNTLPMATLTSVRAALKTIASRMDREKDILFLFLTSHGSKEHELTLTLAGMSLQGLSAARLGELLKESGIRWKVVVVSACYGGGFADTIVDEHTLVIAAARRDRQSFGCADENDFTYFGRAYFKEALPGSLSFHDAFRKAEALVREWELKDAGARDAQAAPSAKAEDQLSLPQLHGAEPIDKHLQRWWAQFR